MFSQLTLIADNDGATKKAEISLVGRTVFEKSFKDTEVFMVAQRIWFTKEVPKVEEIGHNTFLFTFNYENDRNRVWNQRPWMINKSHLLLLEWKPEDALEEVYFDITTFWVQIKAFPLRFMIKINAELIGNLFHKLLRYESATRTNIIGTKHIRLQVDMDVRKPLPLGFFHDMGKGGRWISFQYERLPDMCYRCGILGHIKCNCPAEKTVNMRILGDLYGTWLKAEVKTALLIRK